eukprot:bmy_12594T0
MKSHRQQSGPRGEGLPRSRGRLDRQRATLEPGSNMVLFKEYGVILPASVEECHVGQLYSVAEAREMGMGGGESVEVLMNEPYEKNGEKGQYTHKIYHLQGKVPTFFRMLAPDGALDIYEKSWND